MGYRPKRIYKLAWADDHDMHGLEVTARPMKFGTLLELGLLVEAAKDTKSLTDMEAMAEKFADSIVEWNYEDEDGALLPANAQGLKEMEDWEVFGLLDAYMTVAIGVSEELGKGSPNGGRSQVDLPPMDEL